MMQAITGTTSLHDRSWPHNSEAVSGLSESPFGRLPANNRVGVYTPQTP